MSKSKMHKLEIGTHRPTENRAVNANINALVNEWVNKIHEAGKLEDGGVHGTITRTTYILLDLIADTESGKIPREVISEVVNRCNCQASLKEAALIKQTKRGRNG